MNAVLRFLLLYLNLFVILSFFIVPVAYFIWPQGPAPFPYSSGRYSPPHMVRNPIDGTYRIARPNNTGIKGGFNTIYHLWGLLIIGVIAGIRCAISVFDEEYILYFSFSREGIVELLIFIVYLIIGALAGGGFGYLVWSILSH